MCIANRYKFNKKYRKLQVRAAANPDDIVLQNLLKQATVGICWNSIAFVFNNSLVTSVATYLGVVAVNRIKKNKFMLFV